MGPVGNYGTSAPAPPLAIGTYSDYGTYQAPVNQQFWFENSVYGKGSFVNGVDYTQGLSAYPSQFPNNSTISFSWPCAAGTGGYFAYGWPTIVFGAYGVSGSGPYNPYSVASPGPQQISSLNNLSVSYDVAVGGNLNSFDLLLDNFIWTDNTFKTQQAELSFLPYNNATTSLGGSTAHTFTNAGGSPSPWFAQVVKSGGQIVFQPVVSSGSTTTTNILSGTIDLLEIINYAIAQGWIISSQYMIGLQLGPEPQTPNSYNSCPHQGSVLINSLSYVWN
jgi:hypothetical protein